MKKTTQNWINTSDYDFKTAESLLKAKRYVYVIFMCHLAIEKILKAIISELQNETPPYSHNLKRLAQLGKIDLPDDLKVFINEINLKSVPTRYPEDLEKLSRQLDSAAAKRYLLESKRILEWLKQRFLTAK